MQKPAPRSSWRLSITVKAFGTSADEVAGRGKPDSRDHDEDSLAPAPDGYGHVRPGFDIAGNLAGGILGGASAIVESPVRRLLRAKPDAEGAARRSPRAPEPKPECPSHNPFAAFADEARRM